MVAHHQAKPTDSAERRQVTLLFCDLVGSTALANQLDPEDYHTAMQTYHASTLQSLGYAKSNTGGPPFGAEAAAFG